MKIVVCGSMTSYPKMVKLKSKLERLGHIVVLPDPAKCEHIKQIAQNNYIDTYKLKIKFDYIRKHYKNILKSDCVLIANWPKNKEKNYIGGNAFLEMGFAHILKKPIYTLKPIPKNKYYYHEMKAMKPQIFPSPHQ